MNKLFSDFPKISKEKWEEKLTKELKGADFESSFMRTDEIEDLFYSTYSHHQDASLSAEVPGEYPFTRSGKTTNNDWNIASLVVVTDEKEANIRAEMQAKIDDLTVKNKEVLQQVEQTQHYRVQAESNDAIVQEKSRIQSALNDTMRELGTTKNSLDSITQQLNLKNKEVEEMKSRISELEKLVPPAPKVVKKITVKTEEKPVEISATETNKLEVEVGGTY